MSICCKLVRALAVVLLATSHIASQSPELNSTLYSTIDGAYVAFTNENITFTCIARGSVSSHIAWTSELYIGPGGRRLEFISANRIGTVRSMGNAVAILVDAVEDDFIESRLYIRIQPTFPVASVNCLNIDAGTMTSIMFRLADNDTSVVCDEQSVCPGEAVTCVCTTGSSNILAWVINRLEFTSNDPLETRRSVNASGILTDRYNSSEIQVITSNLNVTASKDDISLQIQCENVDRSTSNPVTISVLQNCPAITTLPVTEPDPSMGPSVDLRAAVGVLATICVILVAPIVILAFVLWWELKKKNEMITNLERENENLNREITGKDEEIKNWKKQLENKIRENEGKDKEFKEEMERLNGEITGKDEEIKNWKKKIGKLENKIRENEGKNKEFKEEMERLNREITRKDEEIRNWKKKIGKLQSQLQVNQEEIDELRKTTNRLRQELKKNQDSGAAGSNYPL